ncbi:MAG TPA: TolC family protein, partial [Hanamia sp.]|nr:TolC family protein [Hanamia sp.]
MAFHFIITIIIINYLRKSLQMRLTMPEWNTKLMWIFYADIAVLVINFSVRRADVLTDWLSIALLALLMYLIYSKKEFKPAAFLLTAMVPYIAVTVITYLIKLINPHWYNSWHDWIDAATTFAIIWAFGSWIMTNRQRKELAKARKKAIEEEENNKVISAMKDQLEFQVAERTMELTQQKEELELALKELKATQSQLIQSEKMASLGELTAGIAHEIQNPLNFVNNFSEV